MSVLSKTVTIPANIAVKILPINTRRQKLLLLNLSPNVTVYMGTDSSVTSLLGANPGFTILPVAAIVDDVPPIYDDEIWIFTDFLVNMSFWEVSK